MWTSPLRAYLVSGDAPISPPASPASEIDRAWVEAIMPGRGRAGTHARRLWTRARPRPPRPRLGAPRPIRADCAASTRYSRLRETDRNPVIRPGLAGPQA